MPSAIDAASITVASTASCGVDLMASVTATQAPRVEIEPRVMRTQRAVAVTRVAIA